jgi:hypothetical protein
MKQVEAAQILNDETVGEAISQFECTEEVKPHSKAATVIELDLALVLGVIVLEMTRLLNRINEDRRGLPTGHTVVMKCPLVTRAISAATSGRLATARWLRTL